MTNKKEIFNLNTVKIILKLKTHSIFGILEFNHFKKVKTFLNSLSPNKFKKTRKSLIIEIYNTKICSLINIHTNDVLLCLILLV